MILKYFKFFTYDDFKNFSKRECWEYFILYTFLPLTPLYIFAIFHHNMFIIILSIVFLLGTGAVGAVPFVARKLNLRDFSMFHLGPPYEDGARILIIFTPFIFSFFSFFSYYLNKLLLGMCFGLMFTIPFILIFFRSNTFNDRSCKKNDEIVLGYPPGLYLSFDTILALIIFLIFYRLDLDYCTKVLLVLMTFIFQFISLFPDKINIYFPLDIQTKKGAIVFIGSLLLIFLSLINIFQINIVFNFDVFSILRLVFFVVLAVIVTKWYLNKKK